MNFAAMTCNRVLHFVDEGSCRNISVTGKFVPLILLPYVSMNYVSDWIDTLCMEWQKQPNDFMIIDGL